MGDINLSGSIALFGPVRLFRSTSEKDVTPVNCRGDLRSNLGQLIASDAFPFEWQVLINSFDK